MRKLAIQRFEHAGVVLATAVDRFLAGREVPIVEGSTATFLFRGEADAVRLIHWVWGLPSAPEFSRVAGSDLWYLVLDLPASSRIEYKLAIEQSGSRQLVQDPLNPRQATDPFGANSVLQTAGYETPEWCRPDPEARRGRLEDVELVSRAFGDQRRVTVYLPARMRDRHRYPLLIVHDGGDYLRYADLATVLDNLIHRLEIPELIVALTYPVERLVEYPDNPAHARFLTEELVPHLERELPISPHPAERGLMGASFGAVASLAAAARFPGSYGRLLLQSGSFAFTDVGRSHRDAVFNPVVEFVNGFRARPSKVADRAYVCCGIYESLIYENRSMLPVLQATGMEVRYAEARDGHNWIGWRDRLREGLSWLFPGPLWMVYE